MSIATILVLAAVAQAAPEPALPPAVKQALERCEGASAGVAARDRIAACTAALADPALKGRLRLVALFQRGAAKGDLADFAGMAADADAALQVPGTTDANRANGYWLRAEARRRQRRDADAAADFGRALALDAAHPDALIGRAQLAIDAKRYADARADLTRVDGQSGLNPWVHAKLHRLRGLAYQLDGKPTEALTDYDRAVQVAPEDADARYARGLFAAEQKRYDAALADYVRVTELAPRYADGFNSVCWTLAAHLRKELDRARTACDTAVALAPKDDTIQDSAGLVALQQRRWQDAWRHYNAAALGRPGYASYLFGRGIAALRLGRAAAGNADIAVAVKADPAIATTFAGYGQQP